MDYFAVGGRPLLSGQIYTNIFTKNRLQQVKDDVATAAIGAPSRHGTSEASTFPAAGRKPEDADPDIDDQPVIKAPTQLHHGFDANEVSAWEPSRFEMVRKLQDASRNRGQVNLMLDKTSGRKVAVKKMPIGWMCCSHTDFVTEHPLETELPWQDLGCTRFLNSLHFPYSCSLLGVYRDNESSYVVMSFATEGDMFTWCETGLAASLERECLVFPVARMIFQGVKQLHDYSIAHRDVSLENILLTKGEDNESLEVRIIDFSMATTSRYLQHCIRGKASYQAPEVHTNEEYDAFLADAFALGVTLYACLMKDYPWLSTRPGGCKCFDYVRKHGFRSYLNKRKLRNSITRVGELMSEPLVQLLEGVLALDPKERLTLGEVCWNGTRRSVWEEPWLMQGPGRG